MFENFFSFAFTAQVFACVFMTGVIWLVQLVQYPGFALSNPEHFVRLHTFHSTRITFVVGPVMFLELLTASALLLLGPWVEPWDHPWGGTMAAINLGSVISLWVLTMFVSVPIHNQLARGYDLVLIRKLTVTNWYRTVLWTLRSLVLLYFVENLR